MKNSKNRDVKLGRNDLCTCGSGLKYKKCCLESDQQDQLNNLNFQGDSKMQMEQYMLKISKIAESKNFTADELSSYLTDKHLDEIDQDFEDIQLSQSPRNSAFHLVNLAMEESSKKKRIAMLYEAIKIYPYIADAWLMIADETATTLTEAHEFFKKAVEAGEKDLGPQFMKNNVGYFWGLTESRPYMRAMFCLAQSHWDLGFEDKSIELSKECIRLNPSDNQGVRYSLMTALLIKNDLNNLEELMLQFKDEYSTHYFYNNALFLFKKSGPKSKQAIAQLIKAVDCNPAVPSYLLGVKKIPKKSPTYYSTGSKEEAVFYCEDSGLPWQETEGALTWLVETIARRTL